MRKAAALLLALILAQLVLRSGPASGAPRTGWGRRVPRSRLTTYEVTILVSPSPLTDSVGYGVGTGQVAGTGRIPGSISPDETHAVYWPEGSSVGIDLHPSDWRYSSALDSNGSQQVGSGNGPPTQFLRHALLWSGSATEFVDLHPGEPWTDSIARAVAGDQQVGNVNIFDNGNESSPYSVIHAAVWNGTPDSYVDLHPLIAGCDRSYGEDTDGTQQVGYCMVAGDTSFYHAVVWQGSAASAVDLHPPDFTHSFAEGVGGGEQVGYAFNTLEGNGYVRALLWHGTAESVVSLHPDGYLATTAFGTNGSQQVGSGGTPDAPWLSHALVWSGSAASVEDLHALLPAEFADGSSIAYDIDADGNITGLAQRPDGSTVGVRWRAVGGSTPTPTPTSPPPSPTPTPSLGFAGRNVLRNAGFELDGDSDGRPDVWSVSSRFEQSNIRVYAGQYSGRFVASDDSSFTVQQSGKVAGGSAYRFSAMVCIPATSDAFTFQLQVKWLDAAGHSLGTSIVKTYTAPTGGWDSVSATVAAPTGARNAAVMMPVTSLSSTIYVDALSLGR